MQNITSLGIGRIVAILALVLTVVLVVVGKLEFMPLGLVLILTQLGIIL